MRIVKGQALQALANEHARLRQQCGACQAQINRLSSFSAHGMAGASVDALTRRVTMQTAIAQAHLAFYQSLILADRKNAQLVQALPTTTPGVMDTSVAEDRMARARTQIRSLEQRRDASMKRAKRMNDEAARRGSRIRVDVASLCLCYQQLIAGQEVVLRLNERVIEQAEQYDRESLNLYRSVETHHLRAATKSAQTFARSGSWGAVRWVGEMNLGLAINAYRGKVEAKAARKSIQDAFFAGDLKASGAAFSAGQSFNSVTSNATGCVRGDLLGFSLSAASYGKASGTPGDDDGNAYVGLEAKASVHGAHGELEGTSGLLSVGYEATVLTGAVSGTLGASLADENDWNPSVVAKAEAKASAFTTGATARVGVDDYNAHAKMKGEALSASAEAGLTLGEDGLEAKAGAEAYLVKGEVSGGVTLLGVGIDVVVEGKAGGLGAKVGAEVNAGSVAGEIGLGAVLGLGARIKVDWSGASAAFERTLVAWDEWWDALLGRHMMGDKDV